MDHERLTLILKALAEKNRLKIVELLSCSDLRACELLTYFNFSQPSLSHHMKTLWDAGIIKKKKEGRWTSYSLDESFSNNFLKDLKTILSTQKSVALQKNILKK